jgi:hypothetical protein
LQGRPGPHRSRGAAVVEPRPFGALTLLVPGVEAEDPVPSGGGERKGEGHRVVECLSCVCFVKAR